MPNALALDRTSTSPRDPEPPTHREHVVGLDMLRFAAALLVVAFHLGYWFWSADVEVAPGVTATPACPELAPHTHFGWVGVQIFFVISGFVIAGSAVRSDAVRFAVGRIVRLAPAMWICATTTLAIALVAGAAPGTHGREWLRSVGFQPFGPWIDDSHWTLAIEVAFYCCVFVLLAIGRIRWLRPAALGIGAVSTAYGALALARQLVAGTPWIQTLPWLALSRTEELLLLAHGCQFALGVLLWLHYSGERRRTDACWRIAFFGGACAQILVTAERFARATADDFGALPALATFCLALALFALALDRQSSLVHRLGHRIVAVRTVGLMTYPLYLVHQEAGVYVIAGLAALGVPRGGALALAVIVALAFSWFVVVALEPPLQRALRTLLLRPACR